MYGGRNIFSDCFYPYIGFFTQAAYQSTDRLALIYKNTNWDYMRLWGANVVLPFGFGGWFDSRLTLSGMEMHQRCDDFSISPLTEGSGCFVPLWIICSKSVEIYR